MNSPPSVLLFWLFSGVGHCVLASLGTQTTRDLIEAMIKDWVQTLILIIGLVALLLGGLVWGLIEWLS